MNQEIAKNLSKLLQTFNDKRVISEGEIKQVLTAIVAILAENKKTVEALNDSTRRELEKTLNSISFEHESFFASLRQDITKTKAEVEKATKEQNDRAFKRIQELINKMTLRIPKDGQSGKDGKDGQPGKDGSPDTPAEIRNKLETLIDDERLDAKAIKGLPDYIQEVKRKGKQMLVGGIRFFENLADVSIPTSSKRQDLVAQYNTTNNRWESGIALTVSTTQPSSPQVNDVWIDIS